MSGHRPLPDGRPANVRNRRIERTRAALLAAFRDLILRGSYDAVSISHVVERADVGRSTFYEHFENKDALLRESMRPLLAVLAAAVCERANSDAMCSIVEHFSENRRLVRALFSSGARDVSTVFLGEMIEEHLRRGAVRFALPLPLKARQIAELQLGLLHAWIAAPHGVDASTVAAEIVAASRALTR